jgi:ribosomal protein S18 acetylase RimI-like enzyme
MAEFLAAVSEHDIAEQIAMNLNQYNRWLHQFSAQSIMLSPVRYFVELEYGRVVGCAGILHDEPNLTKLQHICVLPRCRRRGTALKLAKLAIVNCGTDYIYMTVREDNVASLALARALGFVYVNKHWFRDHWTLSFGTCLTATLQRR